MSNALPENIKVYLERISSAANHTHKLIDALFAFSRSTSTEQVSAPTDLNTLLAEVKNSLKDIIEEKPAIISASPLPVLQVIAFQFQQLLENMIGNTLKYSLPDVRPDISITAGLVSGSPFIHEHAVADKQYHAISIRDNGIGFDQQYVRARCSNFSSACTAKTNIPAPASGWRSVKKLSSITTALLLPKGSLVKGLLLLFTFLYKRLF